MDPRTIDAPTLRARLIDGTELALLDAREQGVFFRSHLFHAACLPLSTLELEIERLVPRRSAPIVWCDGGQGDTETGMAWRAARRSIELGYSDVAVLDGGTAAWARDGGELYSGVNVPSKAFGEFVEHAYGTPRIPASELQAMVDGGTDLVILDSRPMDEFRRMSIPGGVDCPGAELVHRVKEMAPDPNTVVVVNCAGRTRSIIGSQSLINAGLENRVVALENGTMGWELAGYEVARGHREHAPDPSAESRAWSERAAASVGERFRVPTIDATQLAEWEADDTRTTYVLDVRTPQEFRDGHLLGSRNAPGGQLVQATDEYVATRNARLVLVDDNGVRATMTASWLQQLGWSDAVVLDGGVQAHDLATGPTPRVRVPSAPTITVAALAERLAADGPPTILDLGTSLKYRQKGHLPGAWWGVRSRLDEARAAMGDVAELVLTSSDGQLAKLAVDEAAALWPDATVVALAGGTKSWRHADQEMAPPTFARPTTTADDVWYKPYDHEDGVPEQHMQDYLTWEVALVDQIERDPTVDFVHYP
ncbi:MAG: rhodanese-like domain-containing protein [Actinomycetota bacterium]